MKNKNFIYLLMINDLGRGHHFYYANKFLKSKEINDNWRYIGPEFPFKTELDNIEKIYIKNFRKYLTNNIVKLASEFKRSLLLGYEIYKNLYEKDNFILLEDYSFADLISIILLILGRKKISELKIVHRYQQKSIFKKISLKYYFKFVNSFLKISHYADTEPLTKHYQIILNKKINLIPILLNIENLNQSTKQNYIFIPGTLRKDKGQEYINLLLKNEKLFFNQFKFIINKESLNLLETYPKNIEVVDNFLNDKDYEKILKKSSYCLLIYEKDRYNISSSSIFIESICHNAIPLVSEGTWMHKEFLKYDLGFCSVNYNYKKEELKNLIFKINSSQFDKLINDMKNFYLTFHNVKNLYKMITK